MTTLIALQAGIVNAPPPRAALAELGEFALARVAGVGYGVAAPKSSFVPLPSSAASRGGVLPSALPRGFSVCFYDRETGETVACPRDYEVETIGRRHYLFRRGGLAYSVDLEEVTCTCPDFMVRKAGRAGASCKHIRLARVLDRRSRRPGKAPAAASG